MKPNAHKVLVMGIDQALLHHIETFIGNGRLPHIQELIETGVTAEALPSPPCDTPTNWTTIATGAPTAVHGATSFYLHLPGEPFEKALEERGRTQLSRFGNAEYLWEVAERRKLPSFIFNYPAGWPTTFEHGGMSLFTWPIPESLPRRLASPATNTYSTTAEDPHFRITSATTPPSSLVSTLPPQKITLPSKNGKGEGETLSAFLVGKKSHDYKFLAVPSSPKEEWRYVEEGMWSDWISVEKQTRHGKLPCLFKVQVQDIARDGSQITLKFSTMYNTEGWSRPSDLGEQLVRHSMDPDLISQEREVEYLIPGDLESYMHQFRKEALSIAHAINFAKKQLQWRLCFFHFHCLDEVNHQTLAWLSEDAPHYTPEEARKAEQHTQVAYQIVDELIGKLLDTCVDDDTIVVFVADHGAVPTWKTVNIPKALVEADLLHYKQNGNRMQIDWERSRAFPYLEPPYVWVNLKGRDPQGIVNPAEYEDVRDRIMHTLEGLRDPTTGDKIVRMALRREEAAFLGQKGERVGDVVFFLNPPYQIFDGRIDLLNATSYRANYLEKPLVTGSQIFFGAHAYNLPTTSFGDYSISCPMIISGPGIRKGEKVDHPVNLTDLAPTLSKILQIPPPQDAKGRVLHEIFSE